MVGCHIRARRRRREPPAARRRVPPRIDCASPVLFGVMRRGALTLVLVLSVVCAALIAASPGQAAGGWQREQRVARDGAPAVAVNDAGAAVAAWFGGIRRTRQSAVFVATRRPGGRFGAPRTVWRGRSDLSFGPGPEIAIDARGNALVGWSLSDDRRSRVITAEVRDGRVRWRDLGSGGLVRIAGAGPRRWVVAWLRPRSRPGRFMVEVREGAGRAWRAVPAPASTDPSELRLAANRRGAAALVWREDSGQSGTTEIWGATRAPGRGFARRARLSDSSFDAVHPAAGIDDRGNAYALFTRSSSPIDGGAVRIFAGTIDGASARAGGGWGPARTVSGPSGGALQPQLAVDRSGRLVAAWLRATDGGISLEAAYGRTELSAPEVLAHNDASGSPADDPRNHRLAIGSRGHAAVVWVGADLTAATRGPNSTWSVERVTDSPGGSPGIGIDRRGEAVVTWSWLGAFAAFCRCGTG